MNAPYITENMSFDAFGRDAGRGRGGQDRNDGDGCLADLLIASTSRGVMKVATDGFAAAPGIAAKVVAETGGVGFEPVSHRSVPSRAVRTSWDRVAATIRARAASPLLWHE